MAERLKPIIYVAFANDLDNPARNLPGLETERKNVEAALSASSGSDGAGGPERLTELLESWDLEVTANCTPRALTEKFFSNRVAIFHYAGHANPETLLLQTQDGHNIPASSSDIIPFLRDQATLRLIFLNACSTRQWALDLTEGGDSPFCIIATDCPVQDPVALEFARDFYTSMRNDATIEQAFRAALDGARAGLTGRTRDFGAVKANVTNGLPWALYPAAPCAAKQWRLSSGVRDPLLGIPPLGENYPLPASPYVSIRGHQKEDAPIFFGRNAEIRAIYDWAIEETATPVMLLYGQSGSGKSSLLRAGVWPRLESRASVGYYRRDGNLIDDLNLALSMATGVASPEEAAAAWLRSERPAILVLDQIEEAITRDAGAGKGKKANDELQAFFDRLVTIFVDGTTGEPRVPGTKARLILSFRKDYLAEIRNPLAARLPKLVEELWLERLSGEQIVDIVQGPVLREDMRARYRIALEAGFAGHLAESLYDPQSPVSTILQLQLTRLWDLWHPQDAEAAKALEDSEGLAQRELTQCRSAADPFGREQSGAAVCYSRRLYDSVKADDALMKFLHEGLATITDPALEQGLALDLLYEHTTRLGTSQRRTATELRTFYAGRIENLEGLLEKYKQLHLLADAGDESAPEPGGGAAAAGEETSTVLTHDTLAVTVRNEYNLSLLAGPRARRVIENRIRGWNGKTGSDLLDGVELRVVERGLKHMRRLEEREEAFLQASLMRRRRKRQQWGTAAALLMLTTLGLGLLWLRTREAASIRNLDGLSVTNLKSGNELEALLEAMQAGDELQSSWLLRVGNQKISGPVREQLAAALNGTREAGRYPYNALAEEFAGCAVALDAWDRPRLVSVGDREATLDGKPVPALQGTTALRFLTGLLGKKQTCAAVSGTIATAMPTGAVSLWKSGSTHQVQIPGLALQVPQRLLSIALSGSGKLLAEVYRDSANAPNQIRITDLDAGRVESNVQTSDTVHSVAFSSDEAMVGEAGDKGAALWTTSGQPIRTGFDEGEAAQIRFGDAGPMGPIAAAVFRSGDSLGVEVATLRTRDVLGGPMVASFSYGPVKSGRATPPPPTVVALSADGTVIAVGREDGRLDLWSVPRDADSFYGTVLEPDIATGLGRSGLPVNAVAFSADGKFAALVSRAPLPVRVWWVKASNPAAGTDSLSGLTDAACERVGPYLGSAAAARVEPEGWAQVDLGVVQRGCGGR